MKEIPLYKNVKTPSVLITGGSGLIGRYLTSALLSEGYDVSHLSRGTNQFGKVRVFRWDPSRGILDPGVFEGTDFVIHLSGENIGSKRWTNKRKREILESRIDSTKLLFETVSKNAVPLKAFISASATGYYGSVTSDKIFTEEDLPGSDFTGLVCRKWEETADLFKTAGIRTVKIRTAVVLANNEGLLLNLLKPSRYGILVQAGNGGQYLPWIHITDLCNIYLKAIRDSGMTGAFNATAPQYSTHADFVNTLSIVIKKPVFPINAPSWLLKIALGEMADSVLNGSRVSSDKIINEGFRFLYGNLRYAIENVISKE